MIIKILWTWCPNCKKLESNVIAAVDKMECLKKKWINITVVKITDISEIMSYDLMSTPGLVIDEKVVSFGKVCDVEEIISLIKWEVMENYKDEFWTCACNC